MSSNHQFNIFHSTPPTPFSFILATLCASLATIEGDEAFEPTLLGAADEVVQERISDDELILVRGPKARTSASIILR